MRNRAKCLVITVLHSFGRNSGALAIVAAMVPSADFVASLIDLRATLVTPPQKPPALPLAFPDPDTDVARRVSFRPLMLTSKTIVVPVLHDQSQKLFVWQLTIGEKLAIFTRITPRTPRLTIASVDGTVDCSTVFSNAESRVFFTATAMESPRDIRCGQAPQAKQ